MDVIFNEMKKTNEHSLCREEIGLLVDFMSEIFKEEGHKLIGIRGMPRVGKTESSLLQVYRQIKDGMYFFYIFKTNHSR